ncbi:MAG: metal-dependent hydrolase [Campylobacterales bacterium]|nr:metal-dependent hydrolase [Campylobacterales bacterium]
MAMFQQHLNGAVITSGVLTVPIYSAQIISLNEAFAVFLIGIIGGLLPDIDSDNSKPLKISFGIISIVLPFLALLAIGEALSVLQMLLLWGVTSVCLYTLGHFLLFFTVHRGVIHSIPFGLLLGLILYYLFHVQLSYSISFAFLSGLFLFVGFIVHLLLDEIVSLNLLGFEIKNSFGTAMKLYEKNNPVGSVVVYMLIVLLIFLVPFDFDMILQLSEKFKTLQLY